MSRPTSRSIARTLLVALLLPLAAACGADPVTTQLPPEAQIETTTFAPSLGIDLATYTRLASGVYIKDRVVGAGDSTVALGDTVTVHYIGWLPDGTVFNQSSPDAAAPVFTIGAADGPVPGFNAGVIGMKEGGSRMIIIPPSLAYGYAGTRDAFGRYVIPSNSVVVFRVDVWDIR